VLNECRELHALVVPKALIGVPDLLVAHCSGDSHGSMRSSRSTTPVIGGLAFFAAQSAFVRVDAGDDHEGLSESGHHLSAAGSRHSQTIARAQ
jgi:hypothetical protein